jgi:hypothetical protein
MTADELEENLNRRKAPAGEYIVKCHMIVDSDKPLSTLYVEHENGEVHAFIPVIIKVKATEQTATVEVDKEEYNAFIDNLPVLRKSRKHKHKI